MVELRIEPSGTITAIYSDSLKPLIESGISRIARASHVEPIGTEWQADLSPVGGPSLGLFRTRSEALSAEVSWLSKHIINK